MARPSEIETKTVSVRIPMVSYIRILQEAISKNLSLSEYLTLKILGHTELPAPDEKPVVVIPQVATELTTESLIEAPKPSRTVPKGNKTIIPLKKQKKKPTVGVMLQPLNLPDDNKVVGGEGIPQHTSVSQRREILKKQMAKLGRRMAGFSSNGNLLKVQEMQTERETIQRLLNEIKGKRK